MIISEILSNPFGFATVIIGVPTIMGVAIKVVYDKYTAWDEADKASRQRKLAIIRNRR